MRESRNWEEYKEAYDRAQTSKFKQLLSPGSVYFLISHGFRPVVLQNQLGLMRRNSVTFKNPKIADDLETVDQAPSFLKVYKMVYV